MSQTSHEDKDPVLIEAADWFAKARGPEAARWAPELAAWRRARPENEAAYARLLQSWERSAFLTNSALARGRDLRSVSTWSRRPAMRYTAAAAAILLTVGFGTLAIERANWRGSGPPPVEYASAERTIRTIVFASGSRAILDAGSAIELRTEADTRHIRLVKGRVRFEVAPEAATLDVDANGGSIESRNGVFDVAVSSQLTRVVLWQGSLDVTGDLRSATWSNRMKAGQQLLFAPRLGRRSLGKADPGDLGWIHGMLSFEQTRLADAVAALNRYNQTQIRLSSRIGELRVTGAFHANDPEGFARAVGDMFDLTFEHSADGSINLSPGIKT